MCDMCINVCVCSCVVYQALCLEQLSASELLEKVAEKLELRVAEISILLRLTSSGILVLLDDTVSTFCFQLCPLHCSTYVMIVPLFYFYTTFLYVHGSVLIMLCVCRSSLFVVF